MDASVFLNIVIILIIVLYGTYFHKRNIRSSNKGNQIDKALYIEVRRASRLSLQCNMLLGEASDRQVQLHEDLQRLSVTVKRLEEIADKYVGHDIMVDSEDNVKFNEEAMRLILVRQRQILTHLESIKRQIDKRNKPTDRD